MTSSPRHHAARLCTLAALLFAFCLPAVLTAAPAKYSIPAEPAEAALQTFSQQSGAKVLFGHDDVAGIATNAVEGTYEPAAALEILLKGTPLTFSERKPGSFIVKKTPPEVTAGSVRGSLVGEGGKGASGVLVTIRETAQSAETDRYGVFVFPNVAAGTYVLVASAPGYQTMHIDQVQVKAGRDLTIGKEEMRKLGEGVLKLEPFVVHADTVEQLEKFEVTATKPQPFSDRNVDLPRTENDVQPYYIFNSQTIEESGTTSVEDFLRQRLTMNTTVRTTSQQSMINANLASPGLSANATSSINLNGLGADHTLILVNGRQMPGVLTSSGLGGASGGLSTPGQPDLNGIPLAAIDRIEVLPSSAGAIYGAGASGGVINVVLKKAYKGGDLSATYASAWDGNGPSHIVEATFGTSFNHGKTQLLVSAQYSDQIPLLVGDRQNLYNRGYNYIRTNNPAFLGLGTSAVGIPLIPYLGSRLNFVQQSGTTLTFAGTGASFGSSYGSVPTGYTASSNPNTLIPGQWDLTSPMTNQYPNGLLTPLGTYPRRKSLMGTLTHDFSDRLQVHADFSYNGNHAFSAVPAYGSGSLPAGSPVNPFNQSIQITYPINNPGGAVSDSISKAFTIGGTMKLPFDWVAHADYQWVQNQYDYRNDSYVGYLFQGPTFATVPGTSSALANDTNPTPLWNGYNPLLFSLANPPNLEPFHEYYAGSTRTNLKDLTVALAGPILHLPWGEPRVSVRLEHSDNEQPAGNITKQGFVGTPYLGLPDALGYTNYSYATSQVIDSANAEIDLPIFKTKRPLLRSLDFQFNVSFQQSTYDIGTPGYQVIPDYPYNSTPAGTYLFGPNTISRSGLVSVATGAQPYRQKAKLSSHSITGPALSYKPFDDLMIRASVAGGYVPPSYSLLLPTNFAQAIGTTSIVDPKLNGARYNVTSITLGGNPDLNPTTSKSWDLGIVWQPHQDFLKGLRFNVEYVETKQFNQILNPGVQGFINLEDLFPGEVVRDPSSGQITTVYSEVINVAESKQSALTYQLDYSKKTSWGLFDFSAGATIQEHNQRQLTAGGRFLEYVGFPSAGGVAKTKGTATLRWSLHNWVAAWTAVYFGQYNQKGVAGDPGTYANQLQTGAAYTLNTAYTLAQGGNTVPSQTYHNLYLSYAFPKGALGSDSRWKRLGSTFLDGVKVSLVVNNVFNTMPPLDVFYPPFYTSPYGDVQLRNYAITLKKSF